MSKITLGILRDGGPITLEVVDGVEIVEVTADFDIDCDGTGGNPHKDPFFQPATRLQYKGKSLCAEKVPYYVVPPLILAKTKGRVLGSKVVLTNIKNGMTCVAVVGDSGPRTKDGEGSPRAAELLGLNPNPNTGGTDEQIIHAKIFVGVPAVIDGETYELQAA